ncbi:hypothetical protein BJ508DRAFT_243080 [Ascobolus immersus RN42]|uniref:Tat pathway signal sequence n=1 Tax=Ascobolus immersus RN42 TaxID=1160509 RepID=A0A3N4HPR8_ASCIM|nr:hypothetical protein BJ508DRAFT_243080 [Ascobolus immersus RN42]
MTQIYHRMFSFFKSKSSTGYRPTSSDEEFDGYRDTSAIYDSSASEKPRDEDTAQSLLGRNTSAIRRISSSSRLGQIFFVVNLFFFFFQMGLFFFYTGSYRSFQDLKQNKGNILLKALTYHAPILDQIEIPMIEVTVNGTFLNEANSIFRRHPSPEVDAAWERISTVEPNAITKADVLALGRDPLSTAKFTPNFGFGSDAYVIEVDTFHQLHCLDTLRQNLIHTFEHYNPISAFYDPNPNTTSIVTKIIPRITIEHNFHCIDIIRQALTCQPSLEPVTLDWARTQVHPFPDFSVTRRCVDFDKIVEWRERNSADMMLYRDLKKPEWAREKNVSPELVEIMAEREREREERKQRMKAVGLEPEGFEGHTHSGHGDHELP